MNSKFYLILTVTVLLILPHSNIAQESIFEINNKLGRGINMGNMFEAPSEGEWGNDFRDDYFELISELGFDHVRIPIRWDVTERTNLDPPYDIKPEFFQRIKYVVDKALAANLMVIINMHHHEDIFENPEAVKPRFLSQWEQIGSFFKAYDNKLLFEVLNEPHANLTPEEWNVFFKDALNEIRKENPDRPVVMGIAEFGGLSAVPKIVLPEDKNIILSVHYYEPFTFTHQGAEWVGGDADSWLGTKWTNNELEQKEVKNQFGFIKSFAAENNVPINVGEFGAYSKADLESRVLWTNFLARWFEEQGFSWAYWEWSAGFGIFNPATNTLLEPLVNALLTDPFPAPSLVSSKVLYESNFSNSNDGWNLFVTSPANGSLSNSKDGLSVDISKASSEGWHIQLVRNNYEIQKGKSYLVSFTGKASETSSITAYLGRASTPWDSYSGYKGFTIEEFESEFFFTFSMTNPDDPLARMVFDMANTKATIMLTNIKVEEIIDSSVEETVLSLKEHNELSIYPNPTNGNIQVIDSEFVYHEFAVFNTKGQNLMHGPISQNKINIEKLDPGFYLLRLISKDGSRLKKLIKL